jgi:hypothetical protein
MAYFAKLGEGNIVEQVIAVNNLVITDNNGIEQEQLGIDFINGLYGTQDIWKKTSYNTLKGEHTLGGTPFRKNYAGIGYTYDQQRDAFIPPKPFNSWILNENTCIWDSPIPMPITYTSGRESPDNYDWNETNQSWDLVI